MSDSSRARRARLTALACAVLATPAVSQWSVEALPTPRWEICMTAADGKVYFAGGSDAGGNPTPIVEVFDEATGTWSSIPMPGNVIQGGAAAIGSRLFFGSGLLPGGFSYNDQVHEYDTITGTWTSHTLNAPRAHAAFHAVGADLVIAGGFEPGSNHSDRVEVFDTTTSTWSEFLLSGPTAWPTPTVVNGKLLLAGGNIGVGTSTDDIVHVDTVSATTTLEAKLTQARNEPGAATVGSRAWFVGGGMGLSSSDRVDVYDSATDTVSSFPLPTTYAEGAAAAAGNKVVVGGGRPDVFSSPTSKVFVIDVDGTITETDFPAPPGVFPPVKEMIWHASASTARSAYFAGGLDLNFNVTGEVFVYTNSDELIVDAHEISLTFGGTAGFDLHVGAGAANEVYLVLGSTSGTSPGLPVDGLVLPLNFDPYTVLSLTGANQPPFVDNFGTLDASGGAQSQLVVPAGSSPGLAGTTLDHAAVRLSLLTGTVVGISNVATIGLVP